MVDTITTLLAASEQGNRTDTLILAGIQEICVITTPQDQAQFQRTLGDGSQMGDPPELYRAALSERQGQQVGCPEEIAFEQGWISADQLAERAGLFAKTQYGAYLALVLFNRKNETFKFAFEAKPRGSEFESNLTKHALKGLLPG